MLLVITLNLNVQQHVTRGQLVGSRGVVVLPDGYIYRWLQVLRHTMLTLLKLGIRRPLMPVSEQADLLNITNQ